MLRNIIKSGQAGIGYRVSGFRYQLAVNRLSFFFEDEPVSL
jgi:hypothetical protein